MKAKKNANVYEITWTTICIFAEHFHTEVFYTEGAAKAFIRDLEDKRINYWSNCHEAEYTGAIITIRKVVPATSESLEFTDEPVGTIKSMRR